MQWEISGAIAQGILYIAFVGVVGAYAAEWIWKRLDNSPPVTSQWLTRYGVGSAMLGIVLAPLSYLVFVGGINQDGLSGMFDPELWWFLIIDPPAMYALMQWLGYVLVIISLLFHIRWRGHPAIMLLGLAILIVSYTTRGHFNDSVWWVQLLLMVHVTSVALWAGMLLPLWRVAIEPTVSDWQPLYELFGRYAGWVVLSLLLAGTVMTVVHLHTVSDLWTTAYGQLFTLKLLAVGMLLILAALNKWVLVPALEHPHIASLLSKIIVMEMMLVTFIFACTTVFTIMVGYS